MGAMSEQLFCAKCGKLNWSRWSQTCECAEPDYKFNSYTDFLESKDANQSLKASEANG